ncbi:MAG TPA: response regulator [Stellaceae bacterium]|nr:response regulator [Stellaceae bacterium]
MADDATRPRRALIVEDEMLVSMLLEDLLSDLSFDPVGPFARLDEALAAARTETFDFAVLDVNLNGKETYGVADILLERKIPFVFATGYGKSGLPPTYHDCDVLSKPFRRDDLARIVDRIARPAAR